MGGGNAQKSKMAREKNLEKARAAGKGTTEEIIDFYQIKNNFRPNDADYIDLVIYVALTPFCNLF